MLKYLLFISAILLFAFGQNNSYSKTTKQNPAIIFADSGIVFNTYLNSRFGYAINYPKNIFFPQPESENGDGRIFTNREQKEVLRVYGKLGIDAEGEEIFLQQQYKDDIKAAAAQSKKITYKKLAKTFFVLSGYNKGNIFYQKTILANGDFACAILQYPVKDSALYNRLSAAIFTSFR